VYERYGAQFTEVTNKVEEAGGKIEGIFVGAAADAAQAITPILDQINSINTVEVGKKIGAEISDAAQLVEAAFKTDRLSELISLALQVGFENGVPKLGGLLVTVFASPIAYMQASITKRLADLPAMFGGQGMKDDRQKRIEGLQDQYNQIMSKGTKESSSGASAALGNMNQPELMGLGHSGQLSAADMKMLDVISKEIDGVKNEGSLQAYYDQIMHEGPKLNFGGSGGPSEPSEAAKALDALSADLRKNLTPIVDAAGRVESTKGTGTFTPVKGLNEHRDRGESSLDRFAKVGLFVGGGGGPQADYARRTADNTAKGNAILTELVRKVEDLAHVQRLNLSDPFALA
jgi:hypothetical protein